MSSLIWVHTVCKNDLKSQADDKADDNCCDWQFKVNISEHIWAALCENVPLGIWGQRRTRLVYASAQSEDGLHCLLIESLHTAECMNGEQRPDDTLRMRVMNLRVLRVFEGQSVNE